MSCGIAKSPRSELAVFLSAEYDAVVSIDAQPRRRFARNLRARRVELGLSQESLGRVASLHPTEISRLERGVRDPRLATIVQVAHALEVTPAILLEGID